MGDWENLANELLMEIFSYLAVKELAPLSLVCKRWRIVVNDPTVWQKSVKRDFARLFSSPATTWIINVKPYFTLDLNTLLSPESTKPIPMVTSQQQQQQQQPPKFDLDVHPKFPFSNWRQIYSLCAQLSSSTECNCKTAENCSCGANGMGLWQLSFPVPTQGRALAHLKRESARILEARRQEIITSGILLNSLPADQLSSSQLRLLNRIDTEKVREWRLKPCPVSSTPLLLHWMRCRAMSYTLSVEINDEEIVKEGWPKMRFNTSIPVKNLRFKCADAGELWGIRFSSWSDGFLVEYFAKKPEDQEFAGVSFGSHYQFPSNNPNKPDGVILRVDESPKAELEALCLSPDSLLAVTLLRYRQLLKKVQGGGRRRATAAAAAEEENNEHVASATATAIATSGVQRRERTRFRDFSIRRIFGRMGHLFSCFRVVMRRRTQSVVFQEKSFEEKVAILKEFHQEIHAALVKLLPEEIRSHFFS